MRGTAGDAPATPGERFDTWILPEIELLLRVGRTLTRDHTDAEDLVQDTLVRAFRAIGSFDGAHPRAWLLTILRNTQINRTRRRRPQLLDDPDRTMADMADTAGPDQGVEGLVVGSTFEAALEAALTSLPDRFRRAVELVDIDGLTYAEAAAVMGVPVGTVMSRIHRARRRMRDHLSGAGVGPGAGR